MAEVISRTACLDRDAAVPAVSGPVREHEGGRRRVTRLPGVGAAVAQPEDGRSVDQHLSRRLEVAVAVVEDGGVEQLASSASSSSSRNVVHLSWPRAAAMPATLSACAGS